MRAGPFHRLAPSSQYIASLGIDRAEPRKVDTSHAILRSPSRDDEETVRQSETLSVDIDLTFGHSFEQRTLYSGYCTVDCGGQKNVGEDRAATEVEVMRLLVEHVEASHVAEQQIQSSDPAENQATKSDRLCALRTYRQARNNRCPLLSEMRWCRMHRIHQDTLELGR